MSSSQHGEESSFGFWFRLGFLLERQSSRSGCDRPAAFGRQAPLRYGLPSSPIGRRISLNAQVNRTRSPKLSTHLFLSLSIAILMLNLIFSICPSSVVI